MGTKSTGRAQPPGTPQSAKPSALVDTRVIYCGDNLEQHARRAMTERAIAVEWLEQTLVAVWGS
jgi:hypothetical protein